MRDLSHNIDGRNYRFAVVGHDDSDSVVRAIDLVSVRLILSSVLLILRDRQVDPDRWLSWAGE